MKRVTLLIFLCLLAAAFIMPSTLQAQTSTSSTVSTSDLDTPIRNCERQVESWRREQHFELTFAVAIFIFGVVISLLQKSTDKWAKRTTVGLGIAITVLTGVNSRVFTADDRTLRRAVYEGTAVINQLWLSVGAAKDEHLPPEDRKTALAEYSKRLEEFKAVGDKLNGANQAQASLRPSTGFEVVPVAYAQSPTQQSTQSATLPAWTQRPPNETDSTFYFVGKAYDPSLTVAKQNSMDDALHEAVIALRGTVGNVSGPALLDLVNSSKVVQDSAFAYESKRSGYAYFTLVRLSKEIVTIAKVLPQANTSAPTKFQGKGWQPSDLTAHATSGLFALDHDGQVSRLVADGAGPPRIERLFRLRGADSGIAITAGADAVFAAAVSRVGCTVYRYSLASKKLESRLLTIRERCVGIANDGTAIYLSIPDRREIRYWDNWTAQSPHAWTLDISGSPGFVFFDERGHRLIVADDAGNAYSVSVPDGRKQFLSSNVGAVSSITTSRFHILLASGTKILFLARSDNQGENPPPAVQALPGGHIVGVAVDKDDKLWFADYDNKVVEGPLPLI